MNTSEGTITLSAENIWPGDLMDRAMATLRTVHLALAPDNKGWHDDSTLMSVWATLEQVIRDLTPVRNHLQGVDGMSKGGCK